MSFKWDHSQTEQRCPANGCPSLYHDKLFVGYLSYWFPLVAGIAWCAVVK